MPRPFGKMRRFHAADRWSEWRAPWLALVALIVVAASAFAWARRDGRRLVWVPNGVMLLARAADATFFPDSGYAITLGEHEGGAYPVRIAAWYTPQDPVLSEREIRRGIEGAVARRRAARLEPVRGGLMDLTASVDAVPPYVLIGLDFWQFGGFRLDVRLRCAVTLPGVGPTVMEKHVSSNRGGTPTGAMLEQVLTYALNSAAQARCPGDARRGDVAARGEPSPPLAPRDQAPAAPPISVPAVPSLSVGGSVPIRDPARTPEEIRRRATVALARVTAQNAEVTALVMTNDTLQLRVGTAVNPMAALRILALRADGSALERFTPLYEVDDVRIAKFGEAGLKGLSPGVTRVVVRPMMHEEGRHVVHPVSASFIVRVTP